MAYHALRSQFMNISFIVQQLQTTLLALPYQLLFPTNALSLIKKGVTGVHK
jgi:hypothetical protein